MNASRQWLLPDPTGDLLVASTHFFDSYYLHPDEPNHFNPQFYDTAPVLTPFFHWEMSRQWATSRLNVTKAPRGSAKSTHIRRDSLLRLVTSIDPYSIVYATSTHDNAKMTGQILREQCYHNTRIQDDFGPEFRTPLKPIRGSKPTGVEFFYLGNGAWVRSLSSESRLRGLRPRRFRLDDPEYDPRASTSLEVLRAYMEELLFKKVLPMVFRSNTGVDWVGTFVSARHYLYHAMQISTQPSGEIIALDPRFNLWSRLDIKITYQDETNATRSVWPEMWPLTIADKHAANLPNAVSVEEMPLLMGTSLFRREMLGDLTPGDSSFFALTPNPKGRHAWWFEGPDDNTSTTPTLSRTRICYLDKNSTPRSIPLCDFLKATRQFITVDTAFTESTHSDRRCALLMAITPDNELFCLDLWSDRQTDAHLVKAALLMAERWRTPSIHVEVVRESFKLYQRFLSVTNTKLTDTLSPTHTPRIYALRPGTMQKADKIAALDLRFEHSLLKFPLYQRFRHPSWTRLIDQIEGFNPEAQDGGLQHDDEIDCLSMSIFVLRSRLSKSSPHPDPNAPHDPIAALREGTSTLPGGTPIAMGLSLSDIPEDLLTTLLSNEAKPRHDPQNPLV